MLIAFSKTDIAKTVHNLEKYPFLTTRFSIVYNVGTKQ